MATYSQLHGVRDHTFVWALLLSIALHVLAATQLPGLQPEKTVVPKILEVALIPEPQPAAVAPEPAPAPEPEPPKPKPESKPEPKPLPKPKPEPKPEPEAAPALEPEPTPPEPATAPPAPPPVISVAPVEEKPPVITAPPPPPEPLQPQKPTQQEIDAARNQYGNLLARAIARHKQYPRIAQMRGWQGETIVELQIDGNGKVLSSKIQTSSSYEVLDKQALEMVKRASPFPLPPDALRDMTFNLLVPISFRLE